MRKPAHIPDPDEIRAYCLEIQATWSSAERERRVRRRSPDLPRPVSWLPQMVAIADLMPLRELPD